MPSGTTYCHSGPSWLSCQFFHVLPRSVERPQPFPTVPYQMELSDGKLNELTKFHEIEVESPPFEAMCSHFDESGRQTKMPRPYVPTQSELRGPGPTIRTCVPQVVSGSCVGVPICMAICCSCERCAPPLAHALNSVAMASRLAGEMARLIIVFKSTAVSLSTRRIASAFPKLSRNESRHSSVSAASASSLHRCNAPGFRRMVPAR